MARSSRPCLLKADIARPRKKLAVSVDSWRRAVAPMASSDTPNRTAQVSSSFSSLRMRREAPPPMSSPIPTVIAGQSRTGRGTITSGVGTSAKSTATASSGSMSSAWAISLRRSASGPRAFSLSTTQRTAWRVVSEQAAPIPPARRIWSLTLPPTCIARSVNQVAAATAPPVTMAPSVPRTRLPMRTRFSPAKPKSSPTANASHPSATWTTGSNDASMSPPTRSSTCGPKRKPSATYSTPDGSPAPRGVRPPTKKLPR